MIYDYSRPHNPGEYAAQRREQWDRQAAARREEGRVSRFRIEVLAESELDTADIWPDGDAPAEPTAEDVVEAMRAYGSVPSVVREWSLADCQVITVHGDGDSAEYHT